jgi:hypothetical protein
MLLRLRGDGLAHLAEAGMGKRALRRRVHQADPAELLHRQVEAAALGILVDVAQDVGELQRPPLVPRELHAGLLRHAEDAHREASDRTRHPVAIEVQGCFRGGDDVLGGVHRHAVDDGDEVVALQAEPAHRLHQRADTVWRMARIERVDIGAPAVQFRGAEIAGAAVIGNIVDGAAEGVDGIHRLPPVLRQQAHGRVERGTGCRQSGLGFGRHGGRDGAHRPAPEVAARGRKGRRTSVAAIPPSAVRAKPALP